MDDQSGDQEVVHRSRGQPNDKYDFEFMKLCEYWHHVNRNRGSNATNW